MKICGIYAIQNKKNNKIYIGKSIDILMRWQQHLDAAKLNKYDYDFYQDLINPTDFIFIILKECKSDELQQYEQYFIDYYNSLNSYNQVNAIDLSKKESLMLNDSILEVINLLESTSLKYEEIALRANVTINTVNNINRCKTHTQYHNYKDNIRKECNNNNNVGELNPRSKLTEKQVKEIINLLETTTLTYKSIASQFNVTESAIKNINQRHTWKYLSDNYKNNIRQEFKQYKC